MIKANHKNYARWIFIPYMNNLLKKNFSHFYLVNNFPDIPEDKGLIITPNHISWWDGFFAEYLFKKHLNRNLYIMMLEEQLKRYWFFRMLGAYSINPASPLSIRETVNYTREVVADPKNFIVTFPQGEIESFEKRPLTLRRGLNFIIKGIEKDFLVLPVGFKIQYYNEKYPSIIVRFGNLLQGKEIINNYSLYESEFVNNIDLIAEAAEQKIFVKDLFAK